MARSINVWRWQINSTCVQITCLNVFGLLPNPTKYQLVSGSCKVWGFAFAGFYSLGKFWQGFSVYLLEIRAIPFHTDVFVKVFEYFALKMMFVTAVFLLNLLYDWMVVFKRGVKF